MRSSPNAKPVGAKTEPRQRPCPWRGGHYSVGRASLPNPCPNPLAILEVGVRGLSTWVSPLIKATSLGITPHWLSTGWTPDLDFAILIQGAPFRGTIPRQFRS
jgi:hypothetical protein